MRVSYSERFLLGRERLNHLGERQMRGFPFMSLVYLGREGGDSTPMDRALGVLGSGWGKSFHSDGILSLADFSLEQASLIVDWHGTVPQ